MRSCRSRKKTTYFSSPNYSSIKQISSP